MAFWKGTLSFGLVEIPVSLRPAVDGDDLKFSLLDRNDFSPVGNKHYNKKTGRSVEWDNVVRGYEYEPDEYVVLTDEELRNANAKATQTIEIFEFVEQGAIPAVYFDTPYFIEPQKQGSRAYALLRGALERTGRVAVARVVLRTRQRLAAVLVRDSVMVLDLLRYSHELREPKGLDVPAKSAKEAAVSERELKMAERLIGDMTGKWKPEEYRDEYRDDVLALVQRKIKSGKTHTVLQPEKDEPGPRRAAGVVDLMEVLKQSLERRGQGAEATGGARAQGSRRSSSQAKPGRAAPNGQRRRRSA